MAKTIYQKCCELTLRRRDWMADNPNAEIDPGMNFFILMIEQLGGKTMFCCEGHERHGDQPYLMFHGSLALACAIAQSNSFVVEVQDQINTFVLRPYRWLDIKEDMNEFLERAAKRWVKHFGRPNLDPKVVNPTLKKKKATSF